MKLFSGTSNRPLAASVAKERGITLGNVEITRFIDNECRVFVQENVAGEDVFVLQSLSIVADQNLVELCLLGSALKDLGAKKVTAIIPWMGYSKQDKAFRKGEAVSIQLVAKFIEAAGFDRVITVELHSSEVLKFFHVPITEISTHEVLRKALDLTDFVVVSPDKGGTSRSERFAKEAGEDIAYLQKNRDLASGEVTIRSMEGDVSGKCVVIFDDIINTAETAVKTSRFVKQRRAKEVYFLATHAVLAGDASQKLAHSDIDRIVVTDTIVVPKEKQFYKLTVISVSHELASKIA